MIPKGRRKRMESEAEESDCQREKEKKKSKKIHKLTMMSTKCWGDDCGGEAMEWDSKLFPQHARSFPFLLVLVCFSLPSSSSSCFSATAAGGATCSLQRLQQPGRPSWMIKGRDYRLQNRASPTTVSIQWMNHLWRWRYYRLTLARPR